MKQIRYTMMETEQALKANHSTNPNFAIDKKKYALFKNVRNIKKANT
ncbi:MAG: hypothetical protein P1P88_12890 [Bacteroidales bacterium]|nr:hypothetical protein [Bacteroidales bacterium]